MSHPAVPITEQEPRPVIVAELGDELGSVQPLPDPPAEPVRVVEIVGRIVDACARCGRGEIQHAGFSCEQIDHIAARVAYGQLPWRRRLITRKPAGW